MLFLYKEYERESVFLIDYKLTCLKDMGGMIDVLDL